MLATTEIDAPGHTNVLGGDANLARASTPVAASNLQVDPNGVKSRFPLESEAGLRTLAVAAAGAPGPALTRARFGERRRLDRLPRAGGSFPQVSFSRLLSAGTVTRSSFREDRGRRRNRPEPPGRARDSLRGSD